MADDLARRVAESRSAQGLPPTIEDPATLAKVAAILSAARPQATEHREAA